MSTENPSIYQKKAMLQSEDWWAVWLGLFIFALGLGPVYGMDTLGWVTKHNVWIDIAKSFEPASKAYGGLGSFGSAIATWLFLLAITTFGATVMGSKPARFAAGFSLIYWLTFICIVLGNNAYIGATPNQLKGFKISWALSLGEMGLVFAMLVGLYIGNFMPGLTGFLRDAARPEWFIKTGIVILGMAIGIKTVGAMALAGTVIVRGLCAVVEAYLIYWPVTYFIARKWFKFTPEWAAPLASGISVCGVSAAIATGGAIRARPHIPVILSAVIIVFVAVELLFLPFLASGFLVSEPMVAGAWMGLAVKSDGGAVASGAITDALIRSKAEATLGIKYQEGWVLMAATTTKLFIDLFIGVWAFVLAIIWSMFRLDTCDPSKGGGEKCAVSAMEIWNRFPKFVLGFMFTFLVLLAMGLNNPKIVKMADTGAGQANILRSMFFALCFFSIGIVTNVRKLWDAGMGRIVAVYAVCLFGFILWVGLGISWLFYHGIMPPLVK
jgi:uncharacterized membrane protein YadS